MPNQPISVSTAQEMIDSYRKYMEGHGINMNTQTISVKFHQQCADDLAEWGHTPY
jgi:hypothetical protein